jgi:hypothetical protein
MNWFKIRVKDGSERGFYTFVGSSTDSLEALGQKASRGEFIRLDNLLYQEQGEIKEWAQWDKREVPSVCVNPTNIVSIQPFKGDPRTLSK